MLMVTFLHWLSVSDLTKFSFPKQKGGSNHLTGIVYVHELQTTATRKMLDFLLQGQADNVWFISFTARGERKKSHTAGLSIREWLQWIGTSQRCSNPNVFVSSQEWVSSSVLQWLLKPPFESWKAVNPPIKPDFTRSAKSRWWRPWSVCCRWVATVIPWYGTVKDYTLFVRSMKASNLNCQIVHYYSAVTINDQRASGHVTTSELDEMILSETWSCYGKARHRS